MTRKTKLAAVLSAAALLTLGGAATSMAATAGWSMEEEGWVYLDSNGDRVTDAWKKSGENYYYLDSDGSMALDQWIDSTYYVDSNGVMLKEQWVEVAEGDEGPSGDEEGGWYYLGSAGKVLTESWKSINGKYYYFDSDGKMLTGWHMDGDYTYYLGDENDGARATGWMLLEYDEDEVPEEGDISYATAAGDDAYWFYFQTNGKMACAEDGESYVSKSINGSKYYFDENGRMATGWAAVASNSDADGDTTGISCFKYFGDENDGSMAKGWKYLTIHPGDSDDADALTGTAGPEEGDGYWYYFDSNGVPKYLDAGATTLTEATGRVNSYSYFFDEYGCMQSGLLSITLNGSEDAVTAYFGASDSDGKMKTGRQTSVYDGDDERGTYYFGSSGSTKGVGLTGTMNGYLYYNGILVEAEDDSDYQVFKVNDTYYLVNETGKVQTTSKSYKSDGSYAYKIENGTIYTIDSNQENAQEVTDSDCKTLPGIVYDNTYELTSN